jgi:hypothetical protein
MATTKKKSTIKIPVNRHDKSVPHYIAYSPEGCAAKVEGAKNDLAAGYEACVPVDRRQWQTEENWRRWREQDAKNYDYDFIDPEEFVDTFEITGYYRGRSAAGLELKSASTGGDCCMMIKDLTFMVMNADIQDGKVTGRWIYKKRGQNYSVEYLGRVQ